MFHSYVTRNSAGIRKSKIREGEIPRSSRLELFMDSAKTIIKMKKGIQYPKGKTNK